MNDFLNSVKKYIKKDPTLINDNLYNFLYTQLISFNLGEGVIPLKNIEHYFSSWVNQNEKYNNLDIFVDKNHPYFCQFVHPDADDITEEAIKLYIPLNESHIYNGVIMLFDFLNGSGIKHNSKIAKKIRNDDVVIRVSNMEEANKVLDFVKNNSFIQEGLLNTNPFTLNINGVGVAEDSHYSYNEELCKALANLIFMLFSTNSLDKLDVNCFKLYLEQLTENVSEDLKEIYILIIAMLNENIIKDIKTDYSSEEKEILLKKALIMTYKKYGLNHVKIAVRKFIQHKDATSFVRKNNIRLLMVKNLNSSDIEAFLLKSGLNLDEYIDEIVLLNDFNLLENAYKETYIKYNEYQAKIALKKYILNADLSSITNVKSARDNLKYINLNEISNILRYGLKEKDLNTEQLCASFLDYMKINCEISIKK